MRNDHRGASPGDSWGLGWLYAQTQKGKPVALLAGAVVVVLVAMFWKDIYCRLYLDPRLVGRWELTDPLMPII